ncbi:MAG: energy-coupling factor transporter transmembrane protein EcfT [Firmicutes bacterium]|nr:energy-coupling factor transporter transmembrane protein EcfT [Bacillota bacterium]
MNDTFSTYHPILNFGFFLLVMAFSMLFLQPIYLAISLGAAFCYSLYLNGKKGLLFSLGLALPMILLGTIFNPLFNHEGATILWYFPSGNPLTLESIYYGLASSVMIASVILWFSCYNAIMTSDKFIYIFGRLIPSISLIFSMVLRLVPKFKNQAKVIINGQKCIGRDPMNGNLKQRLQNGVRIISILTTWALENGIETADSMRARGYGLKGRTSFTTFRFDSRDKIMAVAMVLMLVITFVPIAAGKVFISYYPLMVMNETTVLTVLNYIAFGILCFLPLLLDLVEDVKWRVLKSKI